MSKTSLNIDPPKEASSKEIQVLGNNEISINYVYTREILDQNKFVIKDVFAFKVAFVITRNNDEIELQIIKECRHRNDWLMWKKQSKNN